ncbi:unnamed protein product, partial [marine sediment metagenome]
MNDNDGKSWYPTAVRAWWVAAASTAVAAAAVAVVIAAMLLWNHWQFTLGEPLESVKLEELKEALKDKDEDVSKAAATSKAATSKPAPSKAAIKRQIRDLDLELRQEYFARRDFNQRGIYLLIGAVTLCLLCARISATLARKLPRTGGEGDEDGRTRLSALGRWSTAGVAVVLVIAAAVVAISSRPPRQPAADYPSAQE